MLARPSSVVDAGRTLTLTCSSQANPVVDNFTWHRLPLEGAPRRGSHRGTQKANHLLDVSIWSAFYFYFWGCCSYSDLDRGTECFLNPEVYCFINRCLEILKNMLIMILQVTISCVHVPYLTVENYLFK